MPRLKRWESPRREGRNDKGKGGTAKKKQWQKRLKMLKNKLKNTKEGEVKYFSFFMFINCLDNVKKPERAIKFMSENGDSLLAFFQLKNK
ncbi:hypothetical protein [Geminocystis sp. NIES-3709]|uniref:hypothetical protein n=1 Tax=Geminocystis sp. NIES-3709 TaxID=1617448 RepID=UPI0005FC7279|nr:hypothetical protein [Geminocystis sp. NIES-3709]BAQ63265.1 hypothetical protein GM3709_30 [Geminocystis sp. NIES-3709]